MDERIDGWMDIWMDRLIDIYTRWRDGWIDRQIDIDRYR